MQNPAPARRGGFRLAINRKEQAQCSTIPPGWCWPVIKEGRPITPKPQPQQRQEPKGAEATSPSNQRYRPVQGENRPVGLFRVLMGLMHWNQQILEHTPCGCVEQYAPTWVSGHAPPQAV